MTFNIEFCSNSLHFIWIYFIVPFYFTTHFNEIKFYFQVLATIFVNFSPVYVDKNQRFYYNWKIVVFKRGLALFVWKFCYILKKYI